MQNEECIDWSGGNTTLVYNVTESQTVVKGGSEKLPFILPFTTVWGILLFRNAITVIDSQLGEDLTPVNSAAGPFFRYIPHSQITWKFLSDRRIVTIEKRSCEEKN